MEFSRKLTMAGRAPKSVDSLHNLWVKVIIWNSTNRVVPNRVVSIGPVYPSKAPNRAGLSLPDYVFVCFYYGTCPVS